MFWADTLLEEKTGKQLINDSTTPSGMIHMGGLKGPIIHDVLHKILKAKGVDVEYWYGFDDADPIDGLPPELRTTHEKYMGVPLHIAPSPTGEGSFGDHFMNKMISLQEHVGVFPKIYRTSVLYKEGKFDKATKNVLDNAAEVRKVYEEIYKKKIADDWFPFQVICPNCGKIGTTKVTAWDGKEVTYECQENLVQWAKGCGQKGTMSPFGGNGKMSWKVEWAAKWWTFGVTIEGAGKDHASAGGSYDVAMKILSDVFKSEPPMKLAYEFFLSGGKKMSSSKGLGLTGEQLLEVLTPEIARFLMIKTPPNQAVEFTPRGTDLIPRLFEDYRRAGEAFREKSEEGGARAYELAQLSEKFEVTDSAPFGEVAMILLNPSMKHMEKDAKVAQLIPYVKRWVDEFAPEDKKLVVQEKLPESAKKLSDLQKDFLRQIAILVETTREAKDLEVAVYEKAKALGLGGKDAFAAIYTALLGKPNGPKASFLLLSLDKDFIAKRFNEV